jgi:hypothetical protein
LAHLHQPYFVTPAKAFLSVIPAKAGIHNVPMLLQFLDSRVRGNDGISYFATPAFAGMTIAGQPVISPVTRY